MNDKKTFGFDKILVDILRKSLHRLEELILGWAEQIGMLTS